MISQEVRSPRAGRFTFSVYARGQGASGDYFRNVFLKNMAARLAIFKFVDMKKDHRKRHEFVTVDFEPTWTPAADSPFSKFDVAVRLRSQDDGANEIEMGIGVAVILEKRSPGELHVSSGESAWIEIDRVELTFDPRPRNDDIKI